MGGHISCHQLSDDGQSCGGCGLLEECFVCVYEDPSKFRGNHCRTSSRAVGFKVMLPLVTLVILLIALFLFRKWSRLNHLRAQQLLFNPKIAKIDGLFAAKSNKYTFRDDILPYLLPAGLKHCFQFDAPIVQITTVLGFVLIITGLIFAAFTVTVPRDVKITVVPHGNDFLVIDFWAQAVLCVVLGVLFSFVGCLCRCCLHRTKQRRFEAFHERLAEMTNQEIAEERILMTQLIPSSQDHLVTSTSRSC